MKRLFKEIISLLKVIVITTIVIALFSTFIIRAVVVKGTSMEPTLHDRDIGLSYIITKKLFGLSHGSIVTVYVEADDQYIVKRVIGLPNDTVESIDGVVYVNDKAIEEKYLNDSFIAEYEDLFKANFTSDFPKLRVPEGEYFLLGDNRPNSKDSRHYGTFKDAVIESNSLFILYPFSNFGIK